MASIQILGSEIVNQIAAGEVVERPAHLVKELIENSLDANSKKIHLDVLNGGRFLRLTDDGQGIFSSELVYALQRHATSKIRQTSDLWNLNSYGFRGEALASVAAVSKLTLKSIEHTEQIASQIVSDFGQVSSVKPSSVVRGTEVLVESLFENVPARLKFLKSDTTENQQIKAVVKALALAYPQTEFKLTIENELQLFYSAKKNKLDRANEVFEGKKLFHTKSQKNQWSCEIVYSSPQDVAKTSKQIWIFAQNRWVQDRALHAAIMDSYRSLLMHGEYPYVSLWLDCDPQEIDVNIHPTKSQIKFQDASTAFRIVQSTLREALEKAPWLSAYQPSSIQQNLSFESKLNSSRSDYQNLSSTTDSLSFKDQSLRQTQYKNKNFDLNDLQKLKVNSQITHQADHSDLGAARAWSSLQIIGQLNLTYLVCQKNDRMVLVDQHAAHERVVFESLMQDWKAQKFEIQDYLFPLAIDLSEDKVEILLQHAAEIQNLGFQIEQLGPQAIGIKAAPSLIKDSSLPLVFEKMAMDLLQNGGSFAIEKKISDLFATMACHSVVRAGQSLSHVEMNELLISMDQFALSSFCPHGRPVSIELSFKEVEKLFGRIN